MAEIKISELQEVRFAEFFLQTQKEFYMFIVIEGIDGSGKSTQAQRLGQFFQSRGEKCIVTRLPSDNAIGKLARASSMGQFSAEREALALLYAADMAQHFHEEIRPALERGDHIICDRWYFSTLAYQGRVLKNAVSCDEFAENRRIQAGFRERAYANGQFFNTLRGGSASPAESCRQRKETAASSGVAGNGGTGERPAADDDAISRILAYNQNMLARCSPDAVLFFDLPPEECMRRISARRTETSIYETTAKLHRLRESFLHVFERLPEGVHIINSAGSEDEVFEKVLEVVRGVLRQ
ncbi:MAG: dTMP kinase [Defluviitaleaceae bacterium]|nr:dTMP kinase [Defluviitaleaceae bacterium]